jgi:O-antigen ligase
MWIWPLLLYLALRAKETSGLGSKVLSLGLFGCLAIGVFNSFSETAKLALVLSAACFLVSLYSVKLTRRVVTATLLIAVITMPLITLMLYKFELHEYEALQFSARHRVVNWAYNSELIAERPLTGYGIRSAYSNRFRATDQAGKDVFTNLGNDQKVLKIINQHSHNFYLQIWLDLGLTGVSLAVVAIVMLMKFVARQPILEQSFLLAAITSAGSLALTGYGLWQSWLIVGIIWAVIAFGLAMKKKNGSISAAVD